MGRKIGSAALIADGHHARIDGWTSLAVLAGVIGAWLGFPVIDPIIGLIITVMILLIVKDSAKTILTRLLDGIEPEYIDRIESEASQVKGVHRVNEVKARWLGHQIVAEMSVSLDSNLTVRDGHEITKQIIHRLQHAIDHLASVHIHADPLEEQGEAFHSHDALHHEHRSDEEQAHNHAHHLPMHPHNAC